MKNKTPLKNKIFCIFYLILGISFGLFIPNNIALSMPLNPPSIKIAHRNAKQKRNANLNNIKLEENDLVLNLIENHKDFIKNNELNKVNRDPLYYFVKKVIQK